MCDEAALGEAGEPSELSDYLQEYRSHCHIGPEGEPGWSTAVLDHTPHLFAIGKSTENVSRWNMDTIGAELSFLIRKASSFQGLK